MMAGGTGKRRIEVELKFAVGLSDGFGGEGGGVAEFGEVA